MKTFKQLHEIANTSHQDLAVDKNINPVSFGNPEVVKKLNAWVGTIAGSYVLPEDAIHKLRSSLAKIGLSFGECNLEGNNGSLEKPLTLFGGRFGKGLETPYDQFDEDDGDSVTLMWTGTAWAVIASVDISTAASAGIVETADD